MTGYLNRRVLGSIIIGIAFVAGSYTFATFGTPRTQMPAAALTSQAPLRVPIPVTDRDGNSVEDWRDMLLPPQSTVINPTVSEDYEPPTTLTGQMSISLLENFARSRGQGPFGSTQEELIQATITDLADRTEQQLYSTEDVTIIQNWTQDDIKNYANAIALIISNNEIEAGNQEVDVLYDIVVNGREDRLAELTVIQGKYETIVRDILNTPVPNIFLKQHLDLINSFSALYGDTLAMSQALTDPAFAFMRLRRYLDDFEALQISLQNMYLVLVPHQRLFTATDSAMFFNNFNPQTSGVR